MKVGIFGSAFNPPTLGHADAIVQFKGQFDEIWLVPSYAHAFGKQMLDFDKRCLMVDAFNEEVAKTGVVTKGAYLEKDMSRPGKPIYSYDLLTKLSEMHPEHQFSLIIGDDNAGGFDAFYKADQIMAKWSVVVAKEREPIRSTLIRERIKNDIDVSDLMFDSVIDV
ncbi:nicotinate-nicotinamide nucleotide adenylyltransferase, partial [Vibrio splendidus]